MMPPTWLTDLRQAADAFAEAVRNRGDGRAGVAAAQAGITAALAEGLDAARTLDVIVPLERAIGVVYRPENELLSHYFQASLPRQFDEFVWFDETRAVTPTTHPF